MKVSAELHHLVLWEGKWNTFRNPVIQQFEAARCKLSFTFISWINSHQKLASPFMVNLLKTCRSVSSVATQTAHFGLWLRALATSQPQTDSPGAAGRRHIFMAWNILELNHLGPITGNRCRRFRQRDQHDLHKWTPGETNMGACVWLKICWSMNRRGLGGIGGGSRLNRCKDERWYCFNSPFKSGLLG